MQQRLNINQLSKSIAETNGCSIFTAETFVKSLFSLIGDKLIEGEHIKIKGFGEFYVDNEKNIIFNIDDEPFYSGGSGPAFLPLVAYSYIL